MKENVVIVVVRLCVTVNISILHQNTSSMQSLMILLYGQESRDNLCAMVVNVLHLSVMRTV